MIYFDQAATSFPKPKEVIDAMVHTMTLIGANPGRSGHKLERKAEETVNVSRETIARLFGASNPNQCVFFQNATIALNQAIKGLPWKKGDHIITTSLEHNSVRRPLEAIKNEYGIHITYLNYNDFILKELEKAITSDTRAIIFTHACNVTGHVLPLNEITSIAKQHNILTVIDASQTVGHIPLHMQRDKIDLLVFPGHKGLRGPQGTGVLLVEGEINLHPIHHGGTGVYSEETNQPDIWPYKFESGTLNTPGIAGLHAALELYEQKGERNVSRETFLTKKIVETLKTYEKVTIYSPIEEDLKLPIVTFNIDNIPSQEVAIILDSHYNIFVRAGFHCNPLSHETHNTLEQGMVRVSINSTNTEQEIEQFLEAINDIIIGYNL